MSVDYNSYKFMSAKDNVPFVVGSFWDENYETTIDFNSIDNSLNIDFEGILKKANKNIDVKVKREYDGYMCDNALKQFLDEYEINFEELIERREMPLYQAMLIIDEKKLTNKDGHKLFLFQGSN